jgi:toxin CptA
MRLQFQFRPSRFLDVLMTLAHGMALAVLYPLDLPFWARATLALAVLVSLFHYLKRAAMPPIEALVLEDGHAGYFRDGAWVAGRLLGDSFVTPYLAVLNILPEGARLARSIVILPGNLDAESFRQLRVCLKWGMRAE